MTLQEAKNKAKEFVVNVSPSDDGIRQYLLDELLLHHVIDWMARFAQSAEEEAREKAIEDFIYEIHEAWLERYWPKKE